MKNAKLLFWGIFFISTINSAMYWEFGIRVQDRFGSLIRKDITVYGYNISTKNYEKICTVNCPDTLLDQTWNAIFNVNTISDDFESALYTLPYYATYVFRIDNDYSKNTVDFQGNYVDMTMIYTEGGEDSGFGSASRGSQAIGIWDMKKITLKNIMGSDFLTVSGIIKLNSEYITAGYTGSRQEREASTFLQTHKISGVDQQEVDSKKRKWRKWDEDNLASIWRDLGTADDYTYTAKYACQYDVMISTNLGGGEIYINSIPYSCPTSNSYLYDDEPNNTIAVYDQEYSGYSCTFDHWEQNNSFYSSQNSLPFNNPSNNVVLTAVFTKKISNVGENLYFGSNQNNPIVLYWEDNPNATSYQIWRKVKINDIWQSPYQIATVDTGVGTYTDGDYKLNAWKQGIELEYDARAVSSSYSQDPYWATVYGSVNAKMNNNLAEGTMTENEVPTEYSISNYPNPFNPTTTINYQMPKDGIVTIKVYDVLGKEVATLVNEIKSAGYYKVDFDASSANGGLTSGVYICSIQATGFNKSIKLLLTK